MHPITRAVLGFRVAVIRSVRTILLVCSVLTVACQPNCQPAPLDPELLAYLDSFRKVYGTTASTVIKPSDVFCGNRLKSSPSAGCGPKARHGIARERVEIRGWVVRLSGPPKADASIVNEGFPRGDTIENEYRLNVLLDQDWPTSADAYSISHPIRINEAITPHNVIHMGGDETTSSSLGNGAWGGSRAAVVHVEVNGWGPARMYTFSGPDVPIIGPLPMATPPPSDWLLFTSDPGVGWPFNPANPPALMGQPDRPLQLNDYVRIVGTLWEDTPHMGWNCEDHFFGLSEGENCGGNGGEAGERAKRCWGTDRGWIEMHPVDYMARIPEPERTSSLEVIAICDAGNVTKEMFPPGPRPTPAARIGYEEFVDGAFTNPLTVSDRVSELSDRIRVTVTVNPFTIDLPAFPLTVQGRFKAVYRVFWQP